MTDRKYLPTFADLVDRLSIVLMKSIFISEHRDAYREEMDLIKHDIGLILEKAPCYFDEDDLYATLVLMLANHFIWINESKVRAGDADHSRLRATHSINGVRNAAKNYLANIDKDRVDFKIDCLAADLPKDLGNWDVW